jgi:8-oxo-dGTP pyrophosphatase MutT (NUDIX family)
MRLISQLIHPRVASMNGTVLKRQAARGIVLREQSVLLLFTERYNDFSFPGGGVDPGESLTVGLQREMEEETGATNTRVLRDFGYLEEYRPHGKGGFDLLHMTSHFFLCEIDQELKATRMEGYEKSNGMRPMWVDLRTALNHNRAVLQRQEITMGMSIQRETLMLELVAKELLQQTG